MWPKKLNLEKIKDAIDALSDEEFHELETWMASQVDEDEDEEDEEEEMDETDDVHALDPDDPNVEWVDTPAFSGDGLGGGWY